MEPLHGRPKTERNDRTIGIKESCSDLYESQVYEGIASGIFTNSVEVSGETKLYE
jgi:hypothetical protein